VKTRALWAVAVLLVLASGCGTSSGSVRQLQAELGILRAELAALRQANDQHTRDAAALRSAVRGLDADVGRLRSSLAETGDTVRLLAARLGAIEDGAKPARADGATTRPATVTQMTVTQTATPAPQPSQPAPASAAAPASAPATAALAPAERAARDGAPREPTPRSAEAETAYQTALAAFRAREYGQAVLEFLDFLGKYPKHSLAPNAQYWIGEAYYIQRDWRQSLIEFQKVLDYNAPNGRAGEALLKIGLCHASLREAARARAAWQRIVQEHPDSEAASKAKNLLAASRAPARR
jgi:tol-pal system protein YbgF